MTNTAAYIKELALDMSMDSVDIHTRIDITQAIERMCHNQPIMLERLRYFALYLRGYTVSEIAERLHIAEKIINEDLECFIIALAEESGYTDEWITQRVPERLQRKADTFLHIQTKAFNDYDIHI